MIVERWIKSGVIAFLVGFATFSFFLRLSPYSAFQKSWHELNRQDDHILMNVIHKADYRFLSWKAEVLWQGGEASGHSMGCAVNIFRVDHLNNVQHFLVTLAGVCPQELAYRGYMIDHKFGEMLLILLISMGVFIVGIFFALRWYVYRQFWNVKVIIVMSFLFLGGITAHLFPWPAVLFLPIQVRVLYPG